MKYNKKIVEAFFKNCGLPECTFEHKFHKTRKWRFDMAFLEDMIAIEVQGGVFSGGRHSRGAGMRKDYEKHNQAVLYGWRMIYVLPEQVLKADLVNLIKKVMYV